MHPFSLLRESPPFRISIFSSPQLPCRFPRKVSLTAPFSCHPFPFPGVQFLVHEKSILLEVPHGITCFFLLARSHHRLRRSSRSHASSPRSHSVLSRI